MKNNEIFELTKDLNCLTNEELRFNQYTVYGVKLFDTVNAINLNLISGTRMEPMPENSTNWRLDLDDKVYIVQNNIEREYTLNERIESVKNSKGRLFTSDRYGYGVMDGKVIEFIIPKRRIKEFQNVNRENIETTFGKADFVKEDYDYQHGALMNNYYIYESRKMKIKLDERNNEIDLIFLGEEIKK